MEVVERAARGDDGGECARTHVHARAHNRLSTIKAMDLYTYVLKKRR